ncbi:Uncharacterised protein [Mycobacterium tuberculosis]|nr:Uncharacterised protein [Mycobacterium tuberculosis]
MIDSSAARPTAAKIAYVIECTKPCGSTSRLAVDTMISAAENATVRPAVITVRRTAASVS